MIDCSVTINYLKEKERMSNHCKIDCDDCPLKLSGYFCHILQRDYPEKAIAIVQKWSDEHPPKTYKDDFFEKFPNARKRKNGIPDVCYKKIYGIKYRYGDCENGCLACWDEVMHDTTESEEKE